MARKRRRRAPRKPTGQIGHLSLDPSARTAEFVTVQFPSTKPEIEQYILDCAIENTRKTSHALYRLTSSPIRNVESDFDFTLPTERGTQYLDLMEVKPPGGTYDAGPASYWVWDFAEAVYAQILKKSAKYGVTRRERIHLLLYSTDWRFYPDRGVFQLLTIWLGQKRHVFRTVLHYAPADQTSGDLIRLCPTKPEERRTVDVRELRQAVIMPADFSRLQVESGGAAVVPVSPPPPDWRPIDS